MNYIKSLFNKIQRFPYLFFLAIIIVGAIISINLTNKVEALQFDAGSYFISANGLASQKLDLIKFFTKPSFIDLGYPFALSILMRLFGDNIVVFQICNFLFWFLATIFIYKALKLITSSKKAFLGSLIMAFSPIYLTFSAKLYSEPFASLGLAMIIYFLIKYKSKKNYLSLLGILLGMMIFFFTKSVYVLLVIPIFYFSLTRKNIYEYLILFFSAVLLITRLYFSIEGGRSDYNLAIQSSKVYQTYSTIGACSVYYLSYPLGKLTLPRFEGACRQNDPQVYMSGYSQNPYLLAENIRNNFSLEVWFKTISANPIKYLTVMISSMTNIVFIEGVYANVTEHFNSLAATIIFGGLKIFFAFYIWFNVVRNFKIFLKYGLGRALLSIIPLLYFFVVVGNYPVEQRYFFPLIPWVYFYASLDRKGINKIMVIYQKRKT